MPKHIRRIKHFLQFETGVLPIGYRLVFYLSIWEANKGVAPKRNGARSLRGKAVSLGTTTQFERVDRFEPVCVRRRVFDCSPADLSIGKRIHIFVRSAWIGKQTWSTRTLRQQRHRRELTCVLAERTSAAACPERPPVWPRRIPGAVEFQTLVHL